LVTASAKFRLAKEIYIIIIINKLFKLCKIKFSVKYAIIVKCHPSSPPAANPRRNHLHTAARGKVLAQESGRDLKPRSRPGAREGAAVFDESGI